METTWFPQKDRTTRDQGRLFPTTRFLREQIFLTKPANGVMGDNRYLHFELGPREYFVRMVWERGNKFSKNHIFREQIDELKITQKQGNFATAGYSRSKCAQTDSSIFNFIIITCFNDKRSVVINDTTNE